MNPVKKNWRVAWTLLFAVTACTNAFALESDRTIGQFVHTSWGEKEGAPQQIFAITQAKDGYLWLASAQGLFRFDGVTFEHYAPPTGPPLPPERAFSLLALPNGNLWIGFASRISVLSNGQARNYTTQDGVPNANIACLVRDREGTIWAGTSIGLARLEGDHWKQVGKEWNFTGKSAIALLIDSKGTLWAATESTIVFLPQGSKSFQSTSTRSGDVPQLVEAANGKLWMAETSRSVRPIPLGVKPPPSDTTEIRVGSQGILFAREGDLWITTVGDGIRRAPAPEQLRGKVGKSSPAVESFTTKDGLADNFGLSAFQDREGDIWIGTLSGLERFRRGGLTPVILPYSQPNSILTSGNRGDIWAFFGDRIFHVAKSRVDIEVKNPDDVYTSAYRERGAATWMMSMRPTLVRFENGHFTRFLPPKELPKPFADFLSITEDGSGVLWLAVGRQGLFRWEQGIWSHFDVPPDFTPSSPTAAFTDSKGRPWFGYGDGTIIYLEGNKIHTVATRQNFPVKGVWSMQGRNNHVWVGGFTGGLVLFDGDRFQKLVPADRPSFEHVFAVQELADGSLWLCEQHGVIHIPASEVRKFLELPSYRAHYEVFDSRDGLPGKAQGTRNSGLNLVEATDGRIWFATDHGIAWLNPATIPASVPPPISIRSFTADGKQFAVQSGLTLPPRNENLRLEYTAMNLSVPERVRYRYKLDGVDRDWQEVGIRHEAFYTNLGPGKYKFHITARNEGGEWNADEAVLDFRISPAWFQTVWFRALCVCVFLFLLWMLYQLRLRQLQRQFNMTLEARVGERTRIARELHDTLLQTFTASLLRFQSVLKMLPARPEEARQRVENVIEQASNAIAEGRDAVQQLRAAGPATVDLPQSISSFVSELASSAVSENAPEFRVQVEGTPRDLNPMVHDEAYRIAAEALRNAIRHAAAKHIEVEIRCDEQQLRLRIRDDGKGIDPDVLERGQAPGHWGLRGMRERARLLGGNLEVWSRSEAGSGTEVELTVPAASAYPKLASRWTIFLRRWWN